MPFYDYICSNCRHEFDVLQKILDPPLKYCPECQYPTLSKKVVAPMFRLKGSGWYETDFKTGDKKNIVHSDKPENLDNKKDSKQKPDNATFEKKAEKTTTSKSTNSAETVKGSAAS